MESSEAVENNGHELQPEEPNQEDMAAPPLNKLHIKDSDDYDYEKELEEITLKDG